MNSRVAIVLGLVLLLVVGFGYLFVAQNLDNSVRLYLNLGFWATKTVPLPVPALIAICTGLGLLAGLLALLPRSLRLSRRVRALERQVALSGASSESTGDGWR